jgi:hypothetical protein
VNILEVTDREACYLEDALMVLMHHMEEHSPPNDLSEMPELQALLEKIMGITGTNLTNWSPDHEDSPAPVHVTPR